MADEVDVQGVIAALDDLSRCLAARDLAGTLRLIVDDPEVSVIPSEGVDVHHGPAEVEAFFRRIYTGPTTYGWRWRDRWVAVEGGWASFVAVGDESIAVDGIASRTIPYCLTGTLVQRDDEWRFLLLHGSEDSSR
jgi:hypothetical protein